MLTPAEQDELDSLRHLIENLACEHWQESDSARYIELTRKSQRTTAKELRNGRS